jgi:tRNA pseudouridine38-40 synthase
MREGAAQLVGKHEFSAFSAASGDAEDRVRTLLRLDIDVEDAGLAMTAVADGFLRYMVRSIVGTLLEVGRGRRPSSSISQLLASGDRAASGPTAPACGLTLVTVDY